MEVKIMKMAQWINLIINIVMCLVLGIAGQVMMGGFSMIAFLQTYLLTMCVGFTVGHWLPINALGHKLAARIGCKEGFGDYFISCVFTASCMTVIMCFSVTFVQAGADFMQPFKMLILPFTVMASACVLLISGVAEKIAKKIVGLE